jgi:hypothetical protein
MGTQERIDNSSEDLDPIHVKYDKYDLNLPADSYDGITIRTKKYRAFIFYLEGKTWLSDFDNQKEYCLELDFIKLIKSKAKVKNVFDLKTGKQLDDAIGKLFGLKAFL